MGTRGNPYSPNIPPMSDPKRIIREARAQQRASFSTAVESQSVEEQRKPKPSILLPELEVFQYEEEDQFKTESPQSPEILDPETILN